MKRWPSFFPRLLKIDLIVDSLDVVGSPDDWSASSFDLDAYSLVGE